ncbi:MAG: isochorismatase family protein [Pseudomonadota bacterium]|nr:isochorismatase family protein [Pseudomonadota bacterium]
MFVPALDDECTSSSIETASGIHDIASRYDVPILPSEKVERSFIASLKAAQRSSLLIYGAQLEGAVTQLALLSLLEGFDVFVIADQCQTAEPLFKDAFQARIQQSGGTLVTLSQISRELAWTLALTDEKLPAT